jgi:hypothetical protein
MANFMLTKSTRFLLLFFFCSLATNLSAQNIRFDRLEQLFDQGYFKLVYKKSKRLLNDPAYDYSLLPSYYKAISLLELAQQKKWRHRHEAEFVWAKDYLLDLKTQRKGQQILQAHRNELEALYADITHHLAALSEAISKDELHEWAQFSTIFFADFNIAPTNKLQFPRYSQNALQLEQQQAIIKEAQQYLGVSYLTAGADPSGFDCSGFTSYVFAQQGIQLPRRAIDQYDFAQKISPEEAQFGDLVFFSNGGTVNHVGILISEKGAPKQMIHASSSIGISIADIEAVTYWKNRVTGYGRVLKP